VLNNFEELVGEPFFDPYSEKESSSSEEDEIAVGDLEINMNERTRHIMDADDPIEYAVGDFLPDADDDVPPPELDDVAMSKIYNDPDEVELAMAVEDSEEAVGSEPELDELAKLFLDDDEEDAVGEEYIFDDILFDDESEVDNWDDSEDALGSSESEEYDSEDYSESEEDNSEDSVGSEEYSESEEYSDDSLDSEDSVGDQEGALNQDELDYLMDILQDDSSDYDEDSVADSEDYSEDDDDNFFLDSEEEMVGDFIETPVGDWVDDSSDYADSEAKVGDSSEFLSEEYDSSDLLPESLGIEDSESDDMFDSEAEEMIGSGMPEGLFKMSNHDDDGLESEEYAVGETPDFLLEESSSNDLLDSSDQDFFDDILADDSLFDEVAVGDSYDSEDDDDDEEAVGDLYEFIDELFDGVDDSVEDEEPVGELDENGWVILDAPPYAPAKNYESRHRQRRDADGWDRNDRSQEPVSEDESGEHDNLSDKERSYRNRRRRRPSERRGRLSREYRPRHRPRERVTTYLDEEAVGEEEDPGLAKARVMLDEIEHTISSLDFLSEKDIVDVRRRLQYGAEQTDDQDIQSMSLDDHLHAIHNLHEVHKRLMELQHKHELEEQSKKEEPSKNEGLQENLDAIHKLHEEHKQLLQLKHKHEMGEQKKKQEQEANAPVLISHSHLVPSDAKVEVTSQGKSDDNTEDLHKQLHDFIMNHKDEDEAKKREEEEKKRKAEEAKKKAEAEKKTKEDEEKKTQQEKDAKVEAEKKSKEEAEKAKAAEQKAKEDAKKKAEEEVEKEKKAMKKKMEEESKSKNGELEKLRKQLADYKSELTGRQNGLEDENKKLKAKLLAVKDVEKARAEDEAKKEEDQKKKTDEEKKKVDEKLTKAEMLEKQKELQRKKEESRRKIDEMKEHIRQKKKQKLQEARDKLVTELRGQLRELKEKAAYRKKMRMTREEEKQREKGEEDAEKKKEREAERKRDEALEEERRKKEKLNQALIDKVKAEKEKDKKDNLDKAKNAIDQEESRDHFPFVQHFFGHTGDLEEECGEARCRCGFYKIEWKYKDHCYMVEGECQECDAADSTKVKAIGFTYKYVPEVKKRLPIFTYRRRGKQWHNEPKEKSVCPAGKIVTGIRTLVAKTSEKHKHSMKIKCGPGDGKGGESSQEVQKKDEESKQKYNKDEVDAQKSSSKGADDPTKCLSKGKSCSCGFQSITFSQGSDGCFVPGGKCNTCGSSNIGTAVQAVGFDYVFNDQEKKELPKFVVRKNGSKWKEPRKQFQCKEGYVVNGVWTSAEKDQEAAGKKRDMYYLSITCRKAEYTDEEKKGPSLTPGQEEAQDQDQDGDNDNSSGDSSSGPVKQHECPPAVSECKCGFSFVAWRKTSDCYQLQGECLECGTPGAVNAIGYNYKFDKEQKKSVYRWRYRTEGKLWSQPERRYSCRQGKIVTNIATSAVRSGEEVKYHLWMKCNDAIPTTPKVALNGMVSWFKYAGWDGSLWKSTVGNFSMSVLGGQIAAKIERGDGAENGVWQVQGTTETKVSFGDIIPRDYTICTLSRYTGPKNQKRILIGTSGNWLHGHWSSQAGVAIYGTWVTRSVNRVEPNTNWLFMCGQNAQRSIIRANGMSIKKANGGIKGQMKLQINKGGCCEKEASDWAVAEIMTWDRYLTFTELIHIEAYFNRILKKGNLDQKPQTTAEVAVFMSQPALTPPAKQEAVGSGISTTNPALSIENAPKLKSEKANVLAFSKPEPITKVKLDLDDDIQQAVADAFDNIHVDHSLDDDSEVALADSEPTLRYRSAAQRTEENLMRTQLGLAKVGGIVNFNVVLLALLVFGVVAITASCYYFSKEQGDSADAYYDSLANELQKFNF